MRDADVNLSLSGYKTIAVAIAMDDGPMTFAGIVPMLDPPRKDTALTVHRIRHAKVSFLQDPSSIVLLLFRDEKHAAPRSCACSACLPRPRLDDFMA